MSEDLEIIKKRKKDHLKIATSSISQVGNPGFDRYRFVHNAAPEINFEEIDASTAFPAWAGRLGKKVNLPFFISCMTGGVEAGLTFNKNLAEAAQKKGVAMGVGSQRIAIEHPEFEKQFKLRKYAPDIPLIANVGLVQLNYGYGLNEFKKCVEMLDADALALHLNPIQEVIQPEGDRNFDSLLPKLEKIVKKIPVPVIVKEVGFGLSKDVVKKFYDIGVRIFDTAGWGGTSWAMVEGLRGKADRNLGELFSQWGIPTVESIKQIAEFKSKLKHKNKPNNSSATNYQSLITILASGGVRTGIDIAKCIALGADLAGIAQPFAKAALVSEEEVERLIDRLSYELKIVMFGVGAKDLKALKSVKLTSDEW